jgi:PAS domain S-box-containing protein
MLENELFALLQATTDAAFSVSEEGEIMSWNKAAEKLLGYSAAEAVHKTCYDILEGMGPLGTRVCHQHCSVAECAGSSTEIPNFDMSVKTRSGERLWINMSTLVFDNQRTGRRLLIHLAHDVTEQKKSEELTHKMLDLSKQLSSVSEVSVRAAPISTVRPGKTHPP